MNRSFLAFAMELFTAVTAYSAPSIWNETSDNCQMNGTER